MKSTVSDFDVSIQLHWPHVNCVLHISCTFSALLQLKLLYSIENIIRPAKPDLVRIIKLSFLKTYKALNLQRKINSKLQEQLRSLTKMPRITFISALGLAVSALYNIPPQVCVTPRPNLLFHKPFMYFFLRYSFFCSERSKHTLVSVLLFAEHVSLLCCWRWDLCTPSRNACVFSVSWGMEHSHCVRAMTPIHMEENRVIDIARCVFETGTCVMKRRQQCWGIQSVTAEQHQQCSCEDAGLALFNTWVDLWAY